MQQRAQIAVLSNQGYSCRSISKLLCCSLGAVVRWKNDLNRADPFKEKARSGRKCKVTKKIESNIVRCAKNNRKSSIRLISRKFNVSRSTVHRTLHKKGLKPYRRTLKPLMTELHKKQRRKWVKATTNTDWNKVVFSDEKIFLLNCPPNRKNDIQWTDCAQNVTPVQVEAHSKGLHVWGAICSKGKTDF